MYLRRWSCSKGNSSKYLRNSLIYLVKYFVIIFDVVSLSISVKSFIFYLRIDFSFKKIGEFIVFILRFLIDFDE
jgi:hypothetical protein